MMRIIQNRTVASAIAAAFAAAMFAGGANAQTFEGYPIQEPSKASKSSSAGANKKKGVPEIVVNANGQGKYTSINAALKDIAEDGIIHVRRGTYNETVYLAKSVKIIGERDGDRSLVEIAPPPNASNCLVFAPEERSSNALVENVRFMVDPNAVSTACVDVREGMFTIKNSDVLGNRHGVGVKVSGGTAVIEGNRITQLAKGVELAQPYTESSSFLLSNTIASNVVGVDVAGYADVTMSGNTLHANESMGVFADGYGELELIGNSFTENKLGLELQSTLRNVSFKQNTVHSNEGHGVYAPNGVRGRFEDNSFIGNKGDAVYVRTGLKPTGVNNVFGENRGDKRDKHYVMKSGLPKHR